MMPQSPSELNIDLWFKKAEEDELSCRSFLKHRDAPPAACCFCAQQMAEKYLKAFLISRSKNFPKIHDLKRLATLIEPYESDIFSFLEDDFNVLNKFYATTRYPGDFPEGFSWQDAEQAFDVALRIKEFVLTRIERVEQKGFGIIAVSIVLAAVMVLGGGFWYVRTMRRAETEQAKQNQQSVAPSSAPVAQTPLTTTDTKNWKTYRNEQYGIKFQYPETFQIEARTFYSPEEPPYVKIFLGDNVATEKNLISFTLDYPLDKEQSFNCVSKSDVATHYLKTIVTPAGDAIICARTMKDIVYFHTLVPSPKRGYAHKADLFADVHEDIKMLTILEKMLSTFKFIK